MDRRLVVAATLLGACGASEIDGPYDGLPLEADITVGVSQPVHVARDRYGIAHIDAQTLADAAFVQGYVMAHDRLPQMDVLRRYSEGTLAELFGARDPSVIDTDLEMRLHRMLPLAQQTWAAMQASTRDDDKQLVVLLQSFSDGVNAYAHSIRTAENPGSLWDLDPALATSFDASRFVEWTPADSLALGRFQALATSWSTPDELELTELYDGLRATYDGDPARGALARDLMVFTPVGTEATIAGFPNVDVDTGSRSDGSAPTTARRESAAAATVQRPQVPHDVLARAAAFFPHDTRGPHAFMRPFAGANAWAIGPTLTATGDNAMLAADQHVQLTNPSLFYPTHIIVRDIILQGGDDDLPENDVPLDLVGVTIPGIPGVLLGSNGFIAWSGSPAEHDVNDVFAETIVSCGVASADCVDFRGERVPIEQRTETIRVGTLGTLDPAQARTVTYESVPHHGPLIPTIDRATHTLVPRTGSTALSVAYTGDTPSFELRAIWNLATSTTIRDGFVALGDVTYGAQNWMLIERTGELAWTTHAKVPLRDAAAYTWNATTNPDAPAPFFVLPGDGSAEWVSDGGGVVSMSPRYLPHTTRGELLVSANADPVGATFDNDPLNGPIVDGRPLYAGVGYADGLRAARIGELLREGPADPDLMARIQHDTRSTFGAKLTPYLHAILAQLDAAPSTPSDVAPYLAGLSIDDHDRLVRARTLLDAWTFATPTGLADGDSATDSAATAVFNAWFHVFAERVLADELAHLPDGFDVARLGDGTIAGLVWALVASPHTMSAGSTGEPIVCDDVDASGPDDSCTKVALQAMLEAMTYLESPAGYGTADPTRWAWGDKHRLVIPSLFPEAALDLPGSGLPGFPRRGDTWTDGDGAAQRFIALAPPPGASDAERIRVQWALPGGVIFDSRSHHYRDLLDDYYLPERHFDVPYLRDEIVRDGESRWVFR